MSGQRGESITITLVSTAESAPLINVDSNHTTERGVNYFVFSDTGGTARVYYVDPSGNRRELSSQTIMADTLTVMDFDFRTPQSDITFDPNTQPAVVSIEGVTYS